MFKLIDNYFSWSKVVFSLLFMFKWSPFFWTMIQNIGFMEKIIKNYKNKTTNQFKILTLQSI
jgi:hypothetical protein